jgi:hypothetical protein
MGRASGIRIMRGSELFHGIEHRADGIRIAHLAGHLLLPLSQELSGALLIVIVFLHNRPESLPKQVE